MRAVKLTVVALVASTSWVTGAIASIPSDAAGRCAALGAARESSSPDAPLQVLSAQRVPQEADAPAHCLVRGYVMPGVGFDLVLPDQWNEKFIEMGCSAHCGMNRANVTWQGCNNALRRGYSCIVTDMGHRGNTVDSLWAYGDLQAQVDFAFRATHVVALAGKVIAQDFYGGAPNRSYFMGCSTGGREGLQEAQRFPGDFDGIIVGAPPVRLANLYLQGAWMEHVIHDAEGRPAMRPESARLLHEAAMAKCGIADGLRTGIVGDPLNCRFDPAEVACRPGQSTNCLTAPEADIARRVYAGPEDSKGRRLTLGGAGVGTELTWDTAGSTGFVEDAFRYLLFFPPPGASWALRSFDFDRDPQRLQMFASLYDASNPDLREFKNSGGKLLAIQGLDDSVIARQAIDYYQTVERTMGGRPETQKFFRLFTIPGMGHCTGGEGAFAVDYLTYLEAWVERGTPPDSLVGSHVDEHYLKEHSSLDGFNSGNPTVGAFLLEFPLGPDVPVTFTRPIYPFPIKTRYAGKGDPRNASSFAPATH